ncbi:MAG: integrase core domain-containing protein [bacterium]
MIDTIEELIKLYPPPTHLRMDHVPEFNCFAEALGLRQCFAGVVDSEWLQHRIHLTGLALGEPFVESFNSRFRDELLNTELFAMVAEAGISANRWRWEYNTLRPHSALQGRTPLEAAQAAAA